MSHKSFRGHAVMYGEEFFVDTDTGEGLDKVLAKIDPLLCKMAARTHLTGHDFEDKKQLLSVIALEGIRAFNPNKNTRLSTFLHQHLHNKIISKIKSQNKISNDAFSYDVEACEDCGGEIQGFEDARACKSCGKQHSKFRKARGELNFSQVRTHLDDDSGELFENTLSNSDNMYNGNRNSIAKTDFRLALNSLAKSIDADTLRILELIYLEDYSIKDAAKEVGLTGWAASIRLKKLPDEFEAFYELFDKDASAA